jgi:hypothetical protein
VNLTLFGMIVSDSFLVYKKSTLAGESPNVFFHKLAAEMIDFEQTTRLQRKVIRDEEAVAAAAAASAQGIHLTPTKRMRAVEKGTPGSSQKKSKTQKHQGKCTVCKTMKSTWTCSSCREAGRTTYICHSQYRPACWREHSRVEHNIG